MVQKFKLPKTLAECADALYRTRAKRLAFAKQLEGFRTLEAALRERLIEQLPRGKASGISGRVARATIETVVIPVISDFEELMRYVGKTKGYDLVQRRLNEAAVRARWENKVAVPGIGKFNDKRVSLEKL